MATGTEIEHLIKMVNQIAENFAFAGGKEEQVPSVVDHITRFWAPPMKEHLLEYIGNGGEGLSEAALAAFDQIKP